jgi:hypothetical protein
MKNQQKLRSASEIDLKSQFATFDGIATKGDNAIVKRIMPFQGFQVMLDYDLAELYGVETKQLKRQVKRNMRRFPSDFMAAGNGVISVFHRPQVHGIMI